LGLYPNPHDHFSALSFNWGCDTTSNFTNCESCPSPTTTSSETTNDTSQATNDNHTTITSPSTDIIGRPGCNVTKKEINSILSDAFTPDTEEQTRKASNGNYTWNWGAV
jgi:hypothetical protein